MSSSVFLEGAVTTADKAVDGDTGVALKVLIHCEKQCFVGDLANTNQC